MIVLEASNTSASLDIETAYEDFKSLSLSDYSGENISILTTLVLKYIKAI